MAAMKICENPKILIFLFYFIVARHIKRIKNIRMKFLTSWDVSKINIIHKKVNSQSIIKMAAIINYKKIEKLIFMVLVLPVRHRIPINAINMNFNWSRIFANTILDIARIHNWYFQDDHIKKYRNSKRNIYLLLYLITAKRVCLCKFEHIDISLYNNNT